MIKVIKNWWSNQKKNDKVLLVSISLILLAIFILKLRGGL